jgi:hypothetical protein
MKGKREIKQRIKGCEHNMKLTKQCFNSLATQIYCANKIEKETLEWVLSEKLGE